MGIIDIILIISSIIVYLFFIFLAIAVLYSIINIYIDKEKSSKILSLILLSAILIFYILFLVYIPLLVLKLLN